MNGPLERYFAAMDELWPRLSEAERQAYREWERSHAFTRNSDWTGWIKYLGPRPENPKAAKLEKSA